MTDQELINWLRDGQPMLEAAAKLAAAKLERYEQLLRRVLEWCEQHDTSLELPTHLITDPIEEALRS